ncbi:hypothetical protein B0H13DRAFT_1851457 [Mycena leptocephala]|nr:hypothetical protein B0H13DRAFT_1851457 [Mycena leptocephala]
MRLLLWQSLCIVQKHLLQLMPPPVDLDEIDMDLDEINEVTSQILREQFRVEALTRVIQTAYTSVKCLGDPRASWSRFKSKFDRVRQQILIQPGQIRQTSVYAVGLKQRWNLKAQLVPKASLELEMIRVLAKEHCT